MTACLHVQAQAHAQAYALGVNQQAAIYGAPVTAGEGGVLLDPQGGPGGAAACLSLGFCWSTWLSDASFSDHVHIKRSLALLVLASKLLAYCPS